MSDNRIAPRTRTFLPARIEIAELGVALSCTIRDLSDTGARLHLSNSLTLPPNFKLYIPKFDRWVRAEQKWRRGDYIGVHFDAVAATSSAPGDPDHLPDARYVKKLEDEISRLKLLLEEIRADPMKARLLLDNAA